MDSLPCGLKDNDLPIFLNIFWETVTSLLGKK